MNFKLSLILIALNGCFIPVNRVPRTVEETTQLSIILNAWEENPSLPPVSIDCINSYQWFTVDQEVVEAECDITGAVGCTSEEDHIVLISNTVPVCDYNRMLRHESIHLLANCSVLNGDTYHSDPRLWVDGGYWPSDITNPMWDNFQPNSVEWRAYEF